MGVLIRFESDKVGVFLYHYCVNLGFVGSENLVHILIIRKFEKLNSLGASLQIAEEFTKI